MLPLRIEKITGRASQENACDVFTKRVSLYDGSLGTIISCFLIKNGQDRDLATALRDLFEITTKKLEESAGSALDSVKMAAESIKEYANNNKIESHFAHLFFFKEACYIVRSGDQVKIWLFEPPKSTEISFENGSGPIDAGQIYLIATEKLLLAFDRSVLLSGEFILEEVIDGLATEVLAKEDQSDIGAVFVQVKKEEGESEGKEESQQPSEAKSHKGDKEKMDEIEKFEESVQLKQAVRFKNPLPAILKRAISELKSLRRGDIRAIFRLRRNIVIFAVVILLILAGSVTMTLREKRQREKLAQFNLHLQQASAKYDEGVAILELNITRAREILIEADREVRLALEIDQNSQEAKELSSGILSKLKETETQTFVNLEVLVEAKEPIYGLASRGKDLTGVTESRVLAIGVSEKTLGEIEGPTGGRSIFFHGDSAFVLTGDKIWRLNIDEEKLEEIARRSGAVDMAVFVGNVYLLSSDQIAKFVPIEGGYSQSGDYLVQKISFDENSRLAIDGAIWVTKGNQILKFLRGEKQTFEISGLTGSIGELGAIYTGADFDNLYVIDRENSALLTISKDGVYKKAYQSPEFGRATDIVVSSDEKIMFLSVGNKILQASLE